MFRFPAVYLIVVLCTILVTPAQAAQRAFVASYGSDANSCVIFSPCRTFVQAMLAVDPNGEVVVLDSAGYGSVTLTQSVSLIAAPGVYAGISVFPGTNGVTIATPGVNVVLRGLTINSQDGDAGILMTAGVKLSIENCVISNFVQQGVDIRTAATVRMVNTIVRDNDSGIYLTGGATATILKSKFFGNNTGIRAESPNSSMPTTTVAISDTIVTGGGVGITVFSGMFASGNTLINVVRSTITNHTFAGIQAYSSAGTASVTLSRSMVTGNAKGFYQSGNGTLVSLGNNTIADNTTNTGTLTPLDPI